MNPTLLGRKLFYILAMVGLLIPLFILGQPPSQPSSSNANLGRDLGRGQGGTLAKLREEYDIGQSSLGDLDPASETMRLASLGLRGLAATILWEYAEYFKEEKYYDLLAATLNQLARLQPHFVSVWEQQAHNLSYNVSAEFDDYHERYNWVKRGIDYLVEGTRYNRRQPVLQWHLGQYTTRKFGRSDEKLQFRELFRNDQAYHKTLMGYGLDIERPDTRGSDRKPDNWLVGRLWYLKAYDLVNQGIFYKKNPILLYAESPMALFYYAQSIEDEGVLDEKAMFAWNRASKAWSEYGSMDLPTTWGHVIQLRGLPAAREAVAKASKEFEVSTLSVVDELVRNGKDRMTPDEWKSLQIPEAERTAPETRLAQIGRGKVLLPPLALAQRLPLEKRSDAIRLANILADKQSYADHISSSRNLVDYARWEMRGEVEQTPTMVAARRQVYEAEKYLTKADLNNALRNYAAAWKNWDRVLRKYPSMLEEESSDILLKSIHRYAENSDDPLDESFPLFWFYRYRAIRDKNKAGEETIRMYMEFEENAVTYEAHLDVPVEVDEPIDVRPEERVKDRVEEKNSPSVVRPPTLDPPEVLE